MFEEPPLSPFLRELIESFKPLVEDDGDDFLLVFAVCEYGAGREEMLLKLREYHPDVIEMKCKEGPPTDEFFASLELNREAVRELNVPLLIWVSKSELKSLIRNAPNLYAWAITIEEFY